MQAMHDYGRRLVVAEAEVEKLRRDLSISQGKLFEQFTRVIFNVMLD